MDNFNVYKDIQARTGGEIYIGAVSYTHLDVYKRQGLGRGLNLNFKECAEKKTIIFL